MHPTCNAIHELPIMHQQKTSTNPQIKYITHGYYRDVWTVGRRPTTSLHYYNGQEPELISQEQEKMVLKTLRFMHNYTTPTMVEVARDALIMEKLTSSPRIMNVYGYCSTTVTTEFMQNEIQSRVVPGSGYIQQIDLHDEMDMDMDMDVQPRNQWSAIQKLKIALSMAESIADLHGFHDGVIVHNDIQLCQWLQRDNGNGNGNDGNDDTDGAVVLGDFNRASIMRWNDDQHEYCKFRTGAAFGNYRSPEEFAEKSLDEQIDVYSFGNNIYALLTGLWPFYSEDDQMAQKKILAGELPFVDDRYRNRSIAEGRLVQVMEECWKFDPKDRIDIFHVVERLRDALDEIN